MISKRLSRFLALDAATTRGSRGSLAAAAKAVDALLPRRSGESRDAWLARCAVETEYMAGQIVRLHGDTGERHLPSGKLRISDTRNGDDLGTLLCRPSPDRRSMTIQFTGSPRLLDHVGRTLVLSASNREIGRIVLDDNLPVGSTVVGDAQGLELLKGNLLIRIVESRAE